MGFINIFCRFLRNVPETYMSSHFFPGPVESLTKQQKRADEVMQLCLVLASTRLVVRGCSKKASWFFGESTPSPLMLTRGLYTSNFSDIFVIIWPRGHFVPSCAPCEAQKHQREESVHFAFEFCGSTGRMYLMDILSESSSGIFVPEETSYLFAIFSGSQWKYSNKHSPSTNL